MSSFASLRSSLRLASTAPAMATRPFSSSASRSIARMIITGRLGSEPELQATASGQEMIRYSVATSNSRDKQQTSWFRVAGFLPEGPYRDLILSLPKGYDITIHPLTRELNLNFCPFAESDVI